MELTDVLSPVKTEENKEKKYHWESGIVTFESAVNDGLIFPRGRKNSKTNVEFPIQITNFAQYETSKYYFDKIISGLPKCKYIVVKWKDKAAVYRKR